jgi:subtilisin
MMMQALQEKIDAHGVAKAIVFLSREHVSSSSEQMKTEVRVDADGRVTRTAAPVRDDVVRELTEHFVPPGDPRLDGAVIAQPSKQMLHLPYLGVVHGIVDEHGLARLQDHDATHSIFHAPEPSRIQPLASNSADTAPAGPTWGLQRLNAPALWARGYTGANIVVAHLDSGADSQHPVLGGAIARYASFDASGHRVEVKGPYKGLDQHGTHTAGTIAGRPLDGGPVVGMAPNAELADATVVGGSDTVSRLLAGLDWSLGKGARVLNLSVGFPGWDDSFEAVIKTLREQQLLPVIAIGNEGPGHTRSPGNYAAALSVGATGEDDKVDPNSSSHAPGGPAAGPAICAPGVNVWSSIPGGRFAKLDGTSMAAPHVAGLAALLFSARPDAAIDEIQQAILDSCSNPANEDAARIGAGIPDGEVALERLLAS